MGAAKKSVLNSFILRKSLLEKIKFYSKKCLYRTNQFGIRIPITFLFLAKSIVTAKSKAYMLFENNDIIKTLEFFTNQSHKNFLQLQLQLSILFSSSLSSDSSRLFPNLLLPP